MLFIDEANIEVSAGDGGAGSVHWHREKFVPRGGPDGGNGGDGGAVVFQVDENLNTLVDFYYEPLVRAEHGEQGGANQCQGSSGNDLVRKVPRGCQVYYQDRLVADLSQPGALWIAARGGRGGKGNAFFKSATNQAPDMAQPGLPGEKFQFKLVLKSVADIGLVGLPNAGKSTLISSISAARPKVADYPFTTLTPNLGVVVIPDGSRYVVADVPGLIPGAHQGKGLGITFLRHIERTKAIAQLIDVTSATDGNQAVLDESISDEELLSHFMTLFEAIDTELKLFSEAVAAKPRLIFVTKGDLPLPKRVFALLEKRGGPNGYPISLISSVTGDGIDEVKRALATLLTR